MSTIFEMTPLNLEVKQVSVLNALASDLKWSRSKVARAVVSTGINVLMDQAVTFDLILDMVRKGELVETLKEGEYWVSLPPNRDHGDE